MDNIKKIEGLEKLVNRASSLILLYKSPQFQEFFLPILKELSTVQSIDPSQYKTREVYQYELMIKNAESFAIKRLLNIIENQESIMASATKQLYTLRLMNDAKGTTKIT